MRLRWRMISWAAAKGMRDSSDNPMATELSSGRMRSTASDKDINLESGKFRHSSLNDQETKVMAAPQSAQKKFILCLTLRGPEPARWPLHLLSRVGQPPTNMYDHRIPEATGYSAPLLGFIAFSKSSKNWFRCFQSGPKCLLKNPPSLSNSFPHAG